MIYAEIGIGNRRFISTEIETPNNERRIRGFYVLKVRSIYLRIQLGSHVIVLDSREGFKYKEKPQNRFKLLFGIVSSA